MLPGQIERNWLDGDLWSLTVEKGYLHDRAQTSAIECGWLREVKERHARNDEHFVKWSYRAKYTSRQTHADQG